MLLAAGLLPAVVTLGAGSPELAPKAPVQDFVAPAPGSYALPPIQRVPQGTVVDIDGRRQAFSRYTTGRVTLLSFMYTYCTDPIGCPLAYETMMTLRDRLLARPELARRLRAGGFFYGWALPVVDTPDAHRRCTVGLLAARKGTAPVLPAWH